MKRILIIGPGYPLRGGLATFNHRLAKEFISEGHDCTILSFSLQYPSVFFPGKTQYSDQPPPDDIKVEPLINSINPLNWLIAGRKIRKINPDVILVRFWIPFMGPSLGTILRVAKRNRDTSVICLADNILPHEKRPGDKIFTRYFLKSCDAFITMSEVVQADLRSIEKEKPVRLVNHPLYDNYGPSVDKKKARAYLKLDPADKILIFFGFIRPYKGLDILLAAMTDKDIINENIKLLVAGEFYEDSKPYVNFIKEYNLSDRVILRTGYIPDKEVPYYICAADCIVQPYKSATQSGVTPLAYQFEKPMIVTNVGGLASLVPDKKAGLVTRPDAHSIAGAILHFYQLGEDYFIAHLRAEKEKYSWAKLTKAILDLSEREVGNQGK